MCKLIRRLRILLPLARLPSQFAYLGECEKPAVDAGALGERERPNFITGEKIALHFSFLGFWPFSINCQLPRFASWALKPETQCATRAKAKITPNLNTAKNLL